MPLLVGVSCVATTTCDFIDRDLPRSSSCLSCILSQCDAPELSSRVTVRPCPRLHHSASLPEEVVPHRGSSTIWSKNHSHSAAAACTITAKDTSLVADVSVPFTAPPTPSCCHPSSFPWSATTATIPKVIAHETWTSGSNGGWGLPSSSSSFLDSTACSSYSLRLLASPPLSVVFSISITTSFYYNSGFGSPISLCDTELKGLSCSCIDTSRASFSFAPLFVFVFSLLFLFLAPFSWSWREVSRAIPSCLYLSLSSSSSLSTNALSNSHHFPSWVIYLPKHKPPVLSSSQGNSHLL